MEYTKEFGQYEPLTRRLHNLLKEYKDGFSVPKELIQNAEDAGATEICFLYDERQNLNARTNLLNDGLGEFQGPALWAYNNKPFTENDLENIRKLGGATKEEDTTKVGKFGLGFNSVYNLTDLPSFVTGNQAVIFDPHATHIGKAGLIADLKNETDIRWKNQLKPYEGVFGCQLNAPGNICEGVLFRFPLRTKTQAQKSQIKDLSYSNQEMQKFFTVFAKYAGSLLLFTQNVQSVKFYFLPESGEPLKGMKLVDVTKSTIYKQLVFDDLSQDASYMNILEYSSEALRRETVHDELQYIDEQNKINVTFAKHSYNAACKINPMTNQTTWQVTWSIGDRDANRFAKSSKLKGLVPLAAVAIPLKTSNTNKEELCTVSDCGTGFYKNGHLFCFMPLPIATQHKIHINATFALTPDRRQLCIKSTDDTDSEEAEWNKVLETHGIRPAWAYALQNLSRIGMVDETVFYEMWPDVSHFDEVEGIFKSFYTLIIQRDLKIFCCHKGKRWSSYTEMLLLDPDLRNSETVGEIALSVFKTYMDDVKGRVIDLPSMVLDSFQSCGLQEEIKERTFTKEMFFKDILFPNITDTFLLTEDRNKLISYFLLSSNKRLQDMVTKNRCIPTKPRGKLKMPSELVSPRGQCANLYLEQEEVFPDQFFCNYQILKALGNLGMTVNELSSQKIIGRAMLIQERKEVRLVRNLLKYLNRNPIHNPYQRHFETHYDVQKRLQSLKILPVLQKQKDWPFKWKEGLGPFSASQDLYQTDVINLVGCCENILDKDVLEITTSSSDVLKWLGIKSKTDVQPETVVNQLRCLSTEMESTSDLPMRKLSTVCHAVYRYLEEYCIMVKQRRIRPNKLQILRDLISHPIVLSASKLIEPQKMAINLIAPLKPYLYEVDEELYQLYPHFLKAVGIREHFGQRDIQEVMTTISHAAHGGKIPGEKLKCYCRAVQVLVDAIGRDVSPVPEVQLPNIDGHLHPASKLCLNDCGWIRDQKHMLFLHPSIAPKDGHELGVRTKREASLAQHITAIPQARAFGQHERLTSRLKRILDGYPNDISILKELLQNADDAGATELMFIKDFRSHKIEKIFGDEWKSLQGPALCVFNNSHFTEEDLVAIQSLGEGSKGQDPLKTGHYGVGFNVVYHLTDVPSFMTIGPEIEKTLCVLDPHQCYTPRTEADTPGIQFKDLNVLRETYKDIFPCYLEDSVMNTKEGTLFRFPLRTEDMADNSELSRQKTTANDIETMLQVFKEEAFSSILFLTSVQKICIATVSGNGKLVIEHTVEASLQKTCQENLQIYVSTLKQDVALCELGSIEPLQIQIMKTLKGSRNEKQDWLIVHRVGFDRNLPLPDDLGFCWKNGEIKLLPRGGVAVPLNRPHSVKGRLFCVLPLPKETGLPIHINGQFILGHEARRDLWQGTNDYRVHWNEHITKAIICPAYIAAIKTLQKLYFPEDGTEGCFEAAISKYHTLFPQIEGTTDVYTKLLVLSFYTAVAANHIPLFPVLQPKTGTFLRHSNNTDRRVEWVPVVTETGFPGYFNTLSNFIKDKQLSNLVSTGMRGAQNINQIQETPAKKRQMLALILKDLGMKIIEACPDIQQQFDKTNFKDAVKGTSPDVVISFLKSSPEINGCYIGVLPQWVFHTPLQSVGNVKRLTKFCKMAERFEEKMINLPLMITQSQILDFLSETKQYIITPYFDLLPQSADKLLHENLVYLYEKLNLHKTSCLRHMDTVDLSRFLGENLDKSIFKTGQPTEWTDIPSQVWICRLWHFLSSEVDKKVNKMMFESNRQKEEDIAIAVLNPLSNWSLIPAFLTQVDHEGNLKDYSFLYPVEMCRSVMRLDYNTNEAFANVLKKLCLPMLKTSIFTVVKTPSSFPQNTHTYWQSHHLCSLIVTGMEDQNNMLDALSKTNGRNLSIYECCTVLSYFDRNMDILKQRIPHLSQRLKALSYFPSLSGSSISVNNFDQVQVVYNTYIPKAGLQQLFLELRHALLSHHYCYDDIRTYLNLNCLSTEQVYSDVIVPNLMKLTPENRMIHLLHIRDNIVQNNQNPGDTILNLLYKLNSVPFITCDGKNHTASDFYSKKVYDFRAMCPLNAFLPAPFDEDEWQLLLELIGLKCQISERDFVQFATKLDRDSGWNITEQVATKSQLLVKHLQQRSDLVNEGILRKIGHIRFVMPFDIEKEAHDGADLIEIHFQYENAKRLVSYSESCDPVFYHNIWTSCSMWTKDADICYHLTRKDAEEAHNQLEMSEEPSPYALVKHFQNVCISIKEKDAVFLRQRKSRLEKLFSEIYQVLVKHQHNPTLSGRLKSLPTVYIVDQCVMVPAEDVVLDLSHTEDIPGYVFKAPNIFGHYFSLFEALGAQKVVTANTYVTVLQKLFMKTKGKKLHPNELKIVGAALFNLIDCLSTTERANIQTTVLYLPNTEHILTDAKSLVYIDNEEFVSRLENLPLNYFIGFEVMELQVYHMPQFPENYEIAHLSELVKETLSPSCLGRVVHSGSASRYEQKIQSSEFVKGILSICFHTSKDISEDDVSKIINKLDLINIRQVDELETVLIHKGKIVDGSELTRDCYVMTPEETEEMTGQSVTVYLNSSRTKESTIHIEITSFINNLTGDRLGRFASAVEKMLDVEPEAIGEILNEYRVKKYTCVFRMSSVKTVYPPVGTLVPDEFHRMLDNSFILFDEGEFVGLDVFDPFADDGQSRGGNHSLPVYVYAIVVKVEDDTSPMAATYLVEVKEEARKTVSATLLYKFHREKTNTTTDLVPSYGILALDSLSSGQIDDILDGIRLQLQDAWEKLNPSQRRRVKLRLFSKWHPDRNPDRVQLCTEVCQYIGLYIQQLENGGSLDVVDARQATYDSSFYDEVTRRNNLHQTFRESSCSSSYASCHQAARCQAYPHLGEAHRWFQQAKRDLNAARQAMSAFTPGNYNWICYMSHQAWEKALKAVLYTTDAAKANALKTHILPNIASDLDFHYQELARKLNDQARHHNRMRYPDIYEYPRIPGDDYKRPDAEATLNLAEMIISTASQELNQ